MSKQSGNICDGPEEDFCECSRSRFECDYAQTVTQYLVRPCTTLWNVSNAQKIGESAADNTGRIIREFVITSGVTMVGADGKKMVV